MALHDFHKSWMLVLFSIFLGFTYIVWLSSGRMDFTHAAYIPPNSQFAWTAATLQTGVGFHEGSRNETLEEDEAFGRAGVRGHVKKGGMIPSVYFTSKSHDLRKTAFDFWLDSYVEGNESSHAPMPYPHCQVYINHHYKFIWIKGHKVGGTSMRKPLGWLCGDNWRVEENITYKYCSEPLFRDKESSLDDIQKWWNEYFVFGIVRNPYSRFASAEEYVKNMFGDSCTKQPRFEEACKAPYENVRFCTFDECCWGGAINHHYRHFMDQTSCLFTDTLLPAVDYLGETESLADDFEEIIAEINKRKKPELPDLVSDLVMKNTHSKKGGPRRGKRRLTQTNSDYAFTLFQKHQHCLEPIYKFYHKDFELLKYEQVESLPSESVE